MAGAVIAVAVLAANPLTSVAWFCLGVFALEPTAGVSRAVSLDIGQEFAGSVSAVMNSCGNLGGTLAGVLTGYIVTYVGWNEPFFIVAGLLFVAALLFMWIDASKRLYPEQPERVPAGEPALA